MNHRRPPSQLANGKASTHTHTPLCSSETLSNIESTEATGRSFSEQMSTSDVLVYSGMADVDSCFHHICTSENLGRYFTFPGLFSARGLGIVGTFVRGAPLVAESQIHICCASLPMGFGWSLYFAQRIDEKRFFEAESLNKSTLVNDTAKVVEINPFVSKSYLFVCVC